MSFVTGLQFIGSVLNVSADVYASKSVSELVIRLRVWQNKLQTGFSYHMSFLTLKKTETKL